MMPTHRDATQRPSRTRPREDDRYPSRFEDRVTISDRRDPVVWGTVGDGPLSARQLQFYEDNGYLNFDDLLDPTTLRESLEELQRLRDDASLRATEEAVLEPDGQALRSLFAVHRSSPVMGRLATHPRLLAIARQLLGGEVYLHQSRVNYKGGFRGEAFYWHSDFETWHVEDGMPGMRAVSCSIALTPNTPHNGPLMLIPGSHQRYVSCVGATPEDHYKASLRQQEVGVPDDATLTQMVRSMGIAAPTGPAGAVTFFDCNLIHGSNSNITPLPRSNVFLVFNSVCNPLLPPFCGLAPRPNFIAERLDFTPLGQVRPFAQSKETPS